MEVRDLAADPELAARLALPGYKAKIERAFVLHLETFDWNCPQHITRRYTESDIAGAVASLTNRIAELEAENRTFRAQLVGHAGAVPSEPAAYPGEVAATAKAAAT